MLQFSANLSFLFPELPFLERFAAARVVGFRGVEFMFPYAFPVADIACALRDNGLQQVLFNLPAGDWDAGERGIASHPGRESEFRDGVALALETAARLRCSRLNCLAGLRLPEVSEAEQAAVLAANLRYAAEACARAGVRLLVEPINSRIDMPGFWLDTPAKAITCIDAAGHDNLYLQFDIYHAQIMTGDLANQLTRWLPRIAHLQIADLPGRHQPGTGEINYPFLFAHLEALGYADWIGCEYRPQGTTVDSLRWAARWLMPPESV